MGQSVLSEPLEVFEARIHAILDEHFKRFALVVDAINTGFAAAERGRVRPAPISHNQELVSEDTFAGHVVLTATQRAYIIYALNELYMNGQYPGQIPGVDRRVLHESALVALLGPLRLKEK